MKLTPELHLFCRSDGSHVGSMAARILTRGPGRTLANSDPAFQPDPASAERARRAHANAVENLTVFAPLVIIAAMTGVSTPVTVLAAKTYLGARVVHPYQTSEVRMDLHHALSAFGSIDWTTKAHDKHVYMKGR